MTTESASATPSSAEVIRRAVEAMLIGKFRCRPGRIESYDAARQVASVKPMLKRRQAAAGGQEIVESMQVVSEVPVLFQRSKDFFISFPLAVGDYVLLIGVDQSIDAFVASQVGADVDPDDFRWWDQTDVVALPGFWPFAAALSDASASNLVLGKDDGGVQVHITSANKVEVKFGGGSATQSAAVAEPLQSMWTAFKTIFDAHIHATPAGPASPTATPAPAWDSAIASTKLKLQD